MPAPMYLNALLLKYLLAQIPPSSWILFSDFTTFVLCPHLVPPPLLSILQFLDVQMLLSVFLFHLLILEYGLQDEQAAFETKKVSFFALVISRVK